MDLQCEKNKTKNKQNKTVLPTLIANLKYTLYKDLHHEQINHLNGVYI